MAVVRGEARRDRPRRHRVFLRQGSRATGTEQIAAAAAVSEQTVSTRFGDEESLFREVVLAIAPTAEAVAADLTASR